MKLESILSLVASLLIGVVMGFAIWGTGGTKQTGSDTTSTTITTPTVQGTVMPHIWYHIEGDSMVFTVGKDTVKVALILPSKPVVRRIPDLDPYPDSIKVQTLLMALREANAEIYRLTQTAYSDTQITIGSRDTLKPSITFVQHLEYSPPLGKFAYRYENPTFRVPTINNHYTDEPSFFRRLSIGTRTSFTFDGSGEPSYGAFATIEIPFGKIGLTPEFGHATDRRTYGSVALSFHPFR